MVFGKTDRDLNLHSLEPSSEKCLPGEGKLESPSRGDPFLLPAYSIIRSVVVGQKLGWIEIMVFVWYTNPLEHQVSFWWFW